jgi:hypothetical protein
MTPEPMVRHAEPPTPAKKRIMMRPVRFGARAQPRLNAQKKTLETFRTMRRP